MKLKKENVQVTIDENKGEILSILIDNNEILYQGDQSWKKTFPILFPAVGIVKNWTVDGKKIDMPKHGYWNQLNWESFYDGNDILLTSIVNSKLLPYTFDVELRITIDKSRVTITATITNAGTNDAYFHFGWHPGFKCLDESLIILSKDERAMAVNTEGLIEPHNTHAISHKHVSELPFNNKIDCLIITDTNINQVTLVNTNYQLNLFFDTPNLVFWKKPSDDFICIEPYYGFSDAFDLEFESELKLKKDIIKLTSAETFTSIYVIDYKETKKH